MNIVLNQKNLIFIFSSLIFILFTNIADLYSMVIDISRWVPVNTPPMSIGDEYHYFSILKMITFGGLGDVPNIEFSRFIPYAINVPIYYIGSTLFDTRFGILFVRFFDMGLLFFSLYYFIGAINYSNNWKKSIYVYIVSIFVIFYGFTGFRTLFSSYDVLSAFNYLLDSSFVYNHSTINSLARAINASATAPIILFVFAYRLKNKIFSLTKFLIFLVILIFTSMPIAVAFGLISVLLDIINKIEPSEITKKIVFGVLLGISLIFVQNKLMFSVTESAEEVINLGLHFKFKFEYFIAPFISIIIALFGRKHLSTSVIVVLIVFSLFQPLSYILGGHWSRLWFRTTIIPYISLLMYLIIVFSYFSVETFFHKNTKYIKIVLLLIMSGLVSILGYFGFSNAIYLANNNERFVRDASMLSNLIHNSEESVIVTNSPQISMLAEVYCKKSKPLMGHYSLQSDGYKKNLAKTIVNFELLGIPEEKLLNKIKKSSPKRLWARKRKNMELGTRDFEDFYFDQILFSSTYAAYNYKMLEDKTKNRGNLLSDSFYKMKLDKSSVYRDLENKKMVFIIDKSMPILPLKQ